MVREVYFARYGAWIPAFPDSMAATFAADSTPLCAAGLRDAETGFFSESYVDGPVEQAISVATGRQIERDSILEVTTLAAARPGYGMQLLEFIMVEATARDMRWGLFTATRQLRRSLRRTGADVFELVPADPAHLVNPTLWGRYYETDPVVCAIAGPAAAADRPLTPGRFAAPAEVDHV